MDLMMTHFNTNHDLDWNQDVNDRILLEQDLNQVAKGQTQLDQDQILADLVQIPVEDDQIQEEPDMNQNHRMLTPITLVLMLINPDKVTVKL